MVADIGETFANLRRYYLKLNPEKYIFGIKSGRFLGYVITKRGIEANPAKLKALQNMKSPQNMREIQRLTGRITTLFRFIFKSADHSLPFFKVLWKVSKFTWDEACDRAFLELKQYLMTLLTLSKLVVGKPLWIYLVATVGAVSSVLL